MRRMFFGSILGVMLAGGLAQAQYRDRYGNPYPYGDRGRYPYGDTGRYGGDYRGDYRYDVVGRALADLDRAGSLRFADHHERRHWEDARKDLIRFQENRSRGRFDRGRLDGAIEHLSHLANARQLHPRDREMLARDLYDLRAYRDRGGYWGR